MFDWLWKTADQIRHAPVQRREAVMIPPNRVKNDPFPAQTNGEKFKSGGSYFGVRLAGLHIVDARQFGAQCFPLFVCLSEFKLQGNDRSLSYTVGPREIVGKLQESGAMKEKDPDPGWIELQDLPIVSPTPVGVGNLSLFVGLYSVPGNDVVGTLLDVVGNLSKSTGALAPAASAVINPALDIAKVVYTGFGSLIGLNTLQALAQAQNGRALPQTGSGYLVVANAPPNSLQNDNITVTGGKLCRDGAMITDIDYCLVAIEHYSTVLEEATGASPELFGVEWNEVSAAIGGDDPSVAKERMRKLMATIRATPVLIDADRAAAMTTYLQKYASAHEEADKANGVINVTRGGAGGGLMAALVNAKNEQADEGKAIAANKLATVFALVDASIQNGKMSHQKPAQVRKALELAGEGGDAAVADALLKAI